MDFLDQPDPLARIGKIRGLDSEHAGGFDEQPAYRKPMSAPQYKSFGQKALEGGASGLNYVVGSLSKPGDAVRGVLAGNGASALKNLIPFSDTMGITSEKDHVSGRDLTDKLGLTNKFDKGWGSWGAGLAADIATDPLSYATFGAKHALTGAGELAKAAGATKGLSRVQMLKGFDATVPGLQAAGHNPSQITHMFDQGRKIASPELAAQGVKAGQPLSGLMNIGLPYGPKATFGTGATAQKIAGAFDRAGDKLKYGNPVGRGFNALFDPNVHGATDEITQRGAAAFKSAAMQRLGAEGRFATNDLTSRLSPLISASPGSESMITDAARSVAEGVKPLNPGLEPLVSDAGHGLRVHNDNQFAQARKAGAPLADAGDPYTRYMHRSSIMESPTSTQLGGKKSALLPTGSGANISRDDLYRNVPGGTERIRDWYKRFAGTTDKKGTAATIRSELENDLVTNGGVMDPKIAQAFDDKAKAMAGAVSKSSHKDGLFSPDLVADQTQRNAQHAGSVSNAETGIGILARNAQKMGAVPDMVPLPQMLRQMGLKTYAAPGGGQEGALVNVLKGLAQHGQGPVDALQAMKTVGPLRKAAAQWGVTPEHAEQLMKQYTKWSTPEQAKAPLKFLDGMTNAFKALTYPIWIPSHVRNLGTGLANNTISGVGWNNYMQQLKVMTGKGSADLSKIHPSLAGLSGPDQIDALRRLQYGHANIFGGHGMNEEIAGNVSQAAASGKRFTPHVPGSDRVGGTGNLAADTADLVGRQGIGGTLGALGRTAGDIASNPVSPRKWGQSLNANLGIKGVAGRAEDALPAVKAGRVAGTNIEDFLRGAQFNRELERGATGAVANDAINKMHFDYGSSGKTDFEKNVMSRLFPFYTFARKNLPLQADIAMHTPGVINAQYKPFMQQGGGNDQGYVPQYMASGVAMPLGGEYRNAEGGNSRQYLSKLGLPAEEAFERLHFANGLPDVRQSFLDYAGQLNPLIKGPLEQISNTQFHTGRTLSDLKPQGVTSALGHLFNDDNPRLLSQIVANSPLTRFASSADKLMDPRKSMAQKAMNLLTGVKVTDVDVDKQRAIDTRNTLNSMLQGHPNLSQYTGYYVRPEDRDKLTPEEMQLMQAYSTSQLQGRAYAAQKKRELGL